MNSEPTIAFAALSALAEIGDQMQPEPDLDYMLWIAGFIAIVVCLVLIGVGIVIGCAAIICCLAVLALGLASSSALIAVVRGKITSGFRALHYQACILFAAPCGIGIVYFGRSLMDWQLSTTSLIIVGAFAGALGGAATAFVLDMVGRLTLKLLMTKTTTVTKVGD